MRFVLPGLCAMVLMLTRIAAAETSSPQVSSAPIIRDGVRIEKLADGFEFPEGPLWHPAGFLLFSDIDGGKIWKYTPAGGAEPWISFNPPGSTNGLMLSNDRRKIYACGHGELSLLEIDAATKAIKVLSKEYNGRAYNHVNDVVVTTAGYVFFTDPKWGEKPGDVQGVYRFNPEDGTTTLAVQMEKQPNGIALSPDQQWLYADRCGGDDIWRFKLGRDGTLAEGGKWIDLPKGAAPDGMTSDKNGNLYVAHAGDGSVQVIDANGRTVRTVKVFQRLCTNCEFENAGPGGIGDGRILYVTGDGRKGKKTGAVYKLTFPQ